VGKKSRRQYQERHEQKNVCNRIEKRLRPCITCRKLYNLMNCIGSLEKNLDAVYLNMRDNDGKFEGKIILQRFVRLILIRRKLYRGKEETFQNWCGIIKGKAAVIIV